MLRNFASPPSEVIDETIVTRISGADGGEQDVDVDPADRVDRVDVLRPRPGRSGSPTARAMSATRLKFSRRLRSHQIPAQLSATAASVASAGQFKFIVVSPLR